jgi:hypothetical protein
MHKWDEGWNGRFSLTKLTALASVTAAVLPLDEMQSINKGFATVHVWMVFAARKERRKFWTTHSML